MRDSGITVLAFILAVALRGSAEAAVLRVPSVYSTIQSALDAAAGGDTVLVAPGSYSGAGNVDLWLQAKDLVIRSEGGPEQTIIDCGTQEWAAGITLYNETRATLFDGFTIRNAHESYGSIDVLRGSPVIRNCILEGGSLPYVTCGVSVRLPGRPRIEDCVIRQCVGGIVVQDGAGAEIVICHLYNNLGTGIYLRSSADVVIQDCRIEGNESGAGNGGGLTVVALGVVEVERCLITRNRAMWSGGVQCELGQLFLRECTITRNLAFGSVAGGGISLSGGNASIEMERCIVWGNCAENGADELLIGGRMTATCSALNRSAITFWGNGSLVENGPQVVMNPRFCDPWPCPGDNTSAGGDYSLRSDSPCLAEFSPCHEQIGYGGVGCQAPVAVGACCLASRVCVLSTSEGCPVQGGNYAGDGQSCYPSPCLPTSVRSVTWGQVKAQFR